MAWNNQGGPWGNGQSPWGGRGGGSGGGGGGGGNQPPDFEEMIRRGQDRMKSFIPGGFGSGRAIIMIVAVAILLWMLSGFYVVNPGQVGVNIIFGRFVSQTEPGLRWNWPAPIGGYETPDVTTRFTTEIGYRSTAGGGKTDVTEESLMLTKDENIIDYQAVVLWRINDVQKYLFEIEEPADSVKNAVEAAIREIIGQSEFQPLTTTLREQVAIQAADLAQKMLDSYNSGILIEEVATQDVNPPQEVIEAFRDVQRARNDANSALNDAQAYVNKVKEGAQGTAVQMVREAEAYKAQKVAIAQGDAQRFISVYNEFRKNPEITERRLYLEAMGRILSGMDKILLDPSAGGSGAVPYLPLDQLIKKTPRSEQPGAVTADPELSIAPSGASQ
jgi:membrane protease subunit HflK